VPSGTEEAILADDGSFTAGFRLGYPYDRTVGPTLSRFFRGLAECRIEGTVGSDGRVYVPPAEFDPVTGDALTEWRTCASVGSVETWSWQSEPGDHHRIGRPFAWALIRLDGADVPMLATVDAMSPDAMTTGMRVSVRWATERVGSIHDISCFVPCTEETV
jgi:uncharacterized protein